MILAALMNISILDFSFDLLNFADAAALINSKSIDFSFICSPGWCSYLTNSKGIYRRAIGMVLIPYELHWNVKSGPRRQRAYAYQDGAHTLRTEIYRMDRDGGGHMLTWMVLIPYEVPGNLQKRPRRQRVYAHRDGAHTLRIPNEFVERTATAEGICSLG